ncbi:hypothetical protein H4582DRAFT_2059540 [Lactarius indigo]|nr:hypothetical protein H4582DRAFT_2059540 [Lactarius indigo]
MGNCKMTWGVTTKGKEVYGGEGNGDAKGGDRMTSTSINRMASVTGTATGGRMWSWSIFNRWYELCRAAHGELQSMCHEWLRRAVWCYDYNEKARSWCHIPFAGLCTLRPVASWLAQVRYEEMVVRQHKEMGEKALRSDSYVEEARITSAN